MTRHSRCSFSYEYKNPLRFISSPHRFRLSGRGRAALPPDADSALQGKRKPELEWNVFWPRWGELDGNGAMRDLAELAKTGVADDIGLPQAAGMVMGSWAAGDPEAAKAWFAGMDPDGRCFRLDDVNLCPQTALIIFPRDVLFVAVLKKER